MRLKIQKFQQESHDNIKCDNNNTQFQDPPEKKDTYISAAACALRCKQRGRRYNSSFTEGGGPPSLSLISSRDGKVAFHHHHYHGQEEKEEPPPPFFSFDFVSSRQVLYCLHLYVGVGVEVQKPLPPGGPPYVVLFPTLVAKDGQKFPYLPAKIKILTLL